MVSMPLRVPVAAGVKVTLNVQSCPGYKTGVRPQLLLRANSRVGVTVMLVTVSGEPPVLVSMISFGAPMEPTTWVAKVRLVAERVATGPDSTMATIVVGPGEKNIAPVADTDTVTYVPTLRRLGLISTPPASIKSPTAKETSVTKEIAKVFPDTGKVKSLGDAHPDAMQVTLPAPASRGAL